MSDDVPRGVDDPNDEFWARIMKKPFWTVEDVARVLTKTKPALYRMRQLSHLPPAMKIGKNLYWDSKKFIDWMNEQADEPFTPPPYKP